MTFESTYLRLGPIPEYNNAHGPIPDVQKDLLMLLWHIGCIINLLNINIRVIFTRPKGRIIHDTPDNSYAETICNDTELMNGNLCKQFI
jgi:hypothetical protein